MEADLYDRISEALERRTRRVQLPVVNPSGVDRIVWSVWDYIMGPELKFVWEVVQAPSTQLSSLQTFNDDDDDRNSSFSSIAAASISSKDEFCTNESPSIHFVKLEESRSQANSKDYLVLNGNDQMISSDHSTLTQSTSSTADSQREPENSGTIGQPSNSSVRNKVDWQLTSDDICAPATSTCLNNNNHVKVIPEESENRNFSIPDVVWDDATTSDDHYVAVHSLSSEIYRTHLGGNSLDFKFMCIPERRLVVAAYVFAAKHKNASARHSLALLMNEKRLQWFFPLKAFFRFYFDDLVPRLKAAALVDTFDEMLSRMSTEFVELFNILGRLEQNSLLATPFYISDSYLAKGNLSSDEFLRRCVAAHLQCQGQTIVLGSSAKKINKMIKTLAFLEPHENWIICKLAPRPLMPSGAVDDDRYCPYLKCQGYHKSEFDFVSERSVYSPWPVCIVDIDSEVVITSLPLYQHLTKRTLALEQDLRQIVGKNAEIERIIVAEFQTSILPDDIVHTFLTQMEFLPYENETRNGFASQFLRYLGHRALALDVFARNASENGNNRKALNLSNVKKALDLQLDGSFMMVLAMADRLRPGLANFIVRKS